MANFIKVHDYVINVDSIKRIIKDKNGAIRIDFGNGFELIETADAELLYKYFNNYKVEATIVRDDLVCRVVAIIPPVSSVNTEKNINIEFAPGKHLRFG